MHKIFYTLQAQADLQDIRNFIASDNILMASKVLEAIFVRVNSLTLFPLIGKQISAQLGFREIIETTYGYRIIYFLTETEIWILMIGKYKQM